MSAALQLRLYLPGQDEPATPPGTGGTMGLSPRMRLSELFADYFLPAYLTGKRPATVDLYRQSLAHWVRLTDDPPLDTITQLTTAGFLKSLLAARSFKSGVALAPRTVRHHVDRLNAVLAAAGQPSRDNEEAAGLLERPPWISTRNLKIPQQLPAGDFTPAEVQRMLTEGAPSMRPSTYIVGLSARTFWTLYVAASFYLGEHRDEILSLKLEHVDGEHVNVPARKKTGKINRKLMHPAFAAMVASTRSERVYLVPWLDWHAEHWPRARSSRRSFDARFQQLLKLSGLPEERRRLGTRGFRKAHLSSLAESSFEDAQLSANHADLSVTLGHYVAGLVQTKRKQQRLDEAIGRLPTLTE